jgi:tetratricopeptide (TPR) repeat protein
VQKTSGGEKVLPAKYQEVMKQALACEKSGDLGMALFHYWNAVDLLPAHPATYLSLAKLHLKRKETESARKAYNKAISLGGVKDPVLDSQIRLLEEREE